MDISPQNLNPGYLTAKSESSHTSQDNSGFPEPTNTMNAPNILLLISSLKIIDVTI